MEEKKSIYAAYEEIKAREISELMDAVRSHGGRYEFQLGEHPTICVNYDEGPVDETVSSVEIQSLSDNERLVIYDNIGQEIKKDDIAYGNIEFITSSIPKKRKIEISDETSRLCETVAELSNYLYGPLYLKWQDSRSVDQEIIRIAKVFEETFDVDTMDFIDEIDKFAKNYFDKEFCNL